MKQLVLLICATCLFSDTLEVVPLTMQETVRLTQLQGAVDAARAETARVLKIEMVAEKKLCAEQAAIKKARKLVETSGSCGSSAWSTELSGTGAVFASSPTTGVSIGTRAVTTTDVLGNDPLRSRWDFDISYKYLVHSK